MTTVKVRAPAKVNLTLHITGQRDDGFHEIDSLVAFGPVCDALTFRHAEGLTLGVDGPEAEGVPTDHRNLVLQMAERYARGRGAQITLTKNLPSAAGIGGGSADAAATFRGLRHLWASAAAAAAPLPAELPPMETLGADIPMCLLSSGQRARGIGARLDYVELPDLPAVLVNPRVAVPTPEVFRRLVHRDNPPMAETLPDFSGPAELIAWLGAQRNDLEAPARGIAPVIDRVLDALAATKDCALARMSGSGATCFGLYATQGAADAAATRIAADHPGWWVAGGVLGSWLDHAQPRFS